MNWASKRSRFGSCASRAPSKEIDSHAPVRKAGTTSSAISFIFSRTSSGRHAHVMTKVRTPASMYSLIRLRQSSGLPANVYCPAIFEKSCA